MLVQAKATVKALDETVQSSEKKLEASKAIADFALSEVARVRKLQETQAAADQEVRSTETNSRKANADMQSDALQLAALKTLAAVSYIGPKLITDYIDRKSFTRQTDEQQLVEARAQLEIEKRNVARAEMQSPVDGVVLKCHQTRRQFLAAGTPLLTIGRLDDMQVRAEVLTERAMHVSPGNPVETPARACRTSPSPAKSSASTRPASRRSAPSASSSSASTSSSPSRHRPPRLGVDFRVNVRIIYAQAPELR